MSEESALLSAIVANPDDRTARLVYADWLDDRDDPRAEIVRLKVQAAGRQDGWPEAQARMYELERGAPPMWLAQLDGRCGASPGHR